MVKKNKKTFKLIGTRVISENILLIKRTKTSTL